MRAKTMQECKGQNDGMYVRTRVEKHFRPRGYGPVPREFFNTEISLKPFRFRG